MEGGREMEFMFRKALIKRLMSEPKKKYSVISRDIFLVA